MIVVVVILLLIIVGCAIFISNLIKQAEKLEERVEDMYLVFEEIRKLSLDTQVNLTELDIRGVFEADDEVGVTFKNIKRISDDLTEYINQLKIVIDETR